MAEFRDRLNQALELRHLKPADLARMTGIGEGAISQYRKGAYKATQRNLDKISQALQVSVAWLMGVSDRPDFESNRLNDAKIDLRTWVERHPSTPSGERLNYLIQRAGFLDDYFGLSLEISEESEDAYGRWIGTNQLPVRAVVDEVLSGLDMQPQELLSPEELQYYQSPDYQGNFTFVSEAEAKDTEWAEPNYPGVTRLTSMRQAPLLGRIACGKPILAEENIEDYVDLPKHIDADFALECKGDSMIGAGIQDGDVVYIRQQPEVENGQIAAVLVGDDEATLKRFYYDGTTVQLVAENPKFAPLVFTGEDINQVRVIGRAVAFTHSLI